MRNTIQVQQKPTTEANKPQVPKQEAQPDASYENDLAEFTATVRALPPGPRKRCLDDIRRALALIDADGEAAPQEETSCEVTTVPAKDIQRINAMLTDAGLKYAKRWDSGKRFRVGQNLREMGNQLIASAIQLEAVESLQVKGHRILN